MGRAKGGVLSVYLCCSRQDRRQQAHKSNPALLTGKNAAFKSVSTPCAHFAQKKHDFFFSLSKLRRTSRNWLVFLFVFFHSEALWLLLEVQQQQHHMLVLIRRHCDSWPSSHPQTCGKIESCLFQWFIFSIFFIFLPMWIQRSNITDGCCCVRGLAAVNLLTVHETGGNTSKWKKT